MIHTAFLIGSIEAVNRKISHLDRKLQACTALVIESRTSDKTDVESYTGSLSDRGEKSRDYDRLGVHTISFIIVNWKCIL